jgi:hypothetical protein
MPLLHRQVKLLEYLTSGDAIFRKTPASPLDSALQGVNRRLLDIEARFSYEKRMEKIFAVFPKTFELIGTRSEPLIRTFTDTCPPVDIGRVENARQFNAFLSTQWQKECPKPRYLQDVAACELSLAEARTSEHGRPSSCVEDGEDTRGLSIRRRRGVVLLRTDYDIRPIFEAAQGAAVPVKRDTRLAIVDRSPAGQPRIAELPPAVFELLHALDDWTERAAFDGAPEADELISDLADADLLEVRH